MQLYEYQAKHEIEQYGIATPDHVLMMSYEGVRQAVRDMGGTVMLKPQSSESIPPVGVQADADLHEIIRRLFGRDMTIRILMVEQAVMLKARVYLRIETDNTTGKLMVTARYQTSADEMVVTACQLVNPFIGLREYQARDMASSLNLPRVYWGRFTLITQAMMRCYMENDAQVLSLNPLGITHANQFIGLNPRMVIDDAALQRQPNFYMLHTAESDSVIVGRAKQVGITYVGFEGNICCITDGAGSGLALLDGVHRADVRGVQPGSLIDVGNLPHSEKIDMALQLGLQREAHEVVMVNLFGGMNSCGQIAENIVATYEGQPPRIPVLIRLGGPGSPEALAFIDAAGISNVLTDTRLEGLVRRAVQIVEANRG
jgi:succinyl-CoA synthetase beta subunit